MKTRTFVSIMFLVLSIMVIAGSFATGQDVDVAKVDDKLFGTWVNLDYDKTWRYAKVVRTPERAYEEYKMSYSEMPVLKGEYTIEEKWTDSKGYTYYKITVTAHGALYYILSKIDKAGNKYEDVWSTLSMPTGIDPENALYRIYYRQE